MCFLDKETIRLGTDDKTKTLRFWCALLSNLHTAGAQAGGEPVKGGRALLYKETEVSVPFLNRLLAW